MSDGTSVIQHATTLTSRPKVMGGFQRRYGRYEFTELSPTHASIGSKAVGKLTIDCELLFRKSKWGVLRNEKFPAGIMYLNLNFGPPQGCRVKSATIIITLEEEDPALEDLRSGRSFHSPYCPVQITEWYGPQSLNGEKKTETVISTTRLTPEVTGPGFGAGGLGYESSNISRREACWTLNGQLIRGMKSTAYKSLKWDLSENELQTQSFRNNKFYTAFAFEHSGQPFLMKVTIKGKLAKWSDRIGSRLSFGTVEGRDDKVVTLVDFEDYRRFDRVLDGEARSLARAMEMENLQEIPVTVPDAVPDVSFQQVMPNADTNSLEAAMEAAGQRVNHAQNQTIEGTGSHPPVRMQPQPPGLPMSMGSTQEGLRTATIEDWERILTAMSRPDVMEEDDDEDISSSVNTLVEPETRRPRVSENMALETVAPKADIEHVVEESTGGREPEAREAEVAALDHDTILWALALPGMLTFLQFLAALMTVLGAKPKMGNAK